jgi:signal transduction histidine kinase
MPFQSRPVSIQTLLVALSALAVLPLIGFALWLLHLVWQNGQGDARRDLQQMASTLAVALDREVAGSVRELERIADFPSLSPERFDEFHAYVRDLVARNRGWDNIALTDPAGRVLLNAALPMHPPPDMRVEQPLVTEVVRTGMPHVSDVYQSNRTGERAVGVSVPVVRDGALRWILIARLTAPELSRFVGSQVYRDGAIAAVQDRNFRLVARSRDAAQHFGSGITPDLRARLEAQPERGTARLTTLDGVPVLAAWERLPYGWTVTIGVPIALFDEQLRRSMGGLLAFGLAVLVAGVALSLLLGRRVSTAIDEVARDAHRLATGEPVVARRSAIRQIDRLFGSLREAAGIQHEQTAARERAVEALREADRRKDEFLAMLAHELRNPLAALRNAVGVLARTRADDLARQRVVAMAERQVRQLTRLVDDLLDVSRITRGKISLQRAPLRLSDAVAEAVDAIRPVADGRGQRLTLHLPSVSPIVDADALRIAQVMENLLSNASKYTDTGGDIDVRLALDGGGRGATIEVRDTGIGLPPGQIDSVFELFTQVDSGAERAQGGLGIGLSLVRRLVELHGGTVAAYSDGPGHGARFVVRLPCVPETETA